MAWLQKTSSHDNPRDGMKSGISYFGNRIPEHYRERDFPEIVSTGCTYVLHTFSEEDMRFYRESVREMVQDTRRAGLEVYVDPWGVGGIFAGEAFSDFLVQHPETWQVRADDMRVPAACPNNAQFRAYMREWLDAAAELAPDVVFWDDPHLYFPPGPIGEGREWTCRCAQCQELYRQRYGQPMPVRMTPEVADFREDSLAEFIRWGCAYARGKGMRNTLGLLAFDDPEHTFVHWEKVAALPEVDALAVSIFPQLFHQERDRFVSQWARRTVELCRANGKEPVVWLQAFLIGAGEEEELAKIAEMAYQEGVRNVAAWGFRGCAHMPAIRCQRPDVMWQVIGETFRALHSRG